MQVHDVVADRSSAASVSLSVLLLAVPVRINYSAIMAGHGDDGDAQEG